jgi:ATP-dependent Clp protease ATP-binding subunit ClpB
VSILRGLKERYEAHHGVGIADAALVAAARLAARYVTGRFLPDKAIDLLDEAAAGVRVQLDSQPEAIDRLARRRTQLEVEARALRREPDAASARRLRDVEAEAAAAAAQLETLRAAHAVERARVGRLRELRQRIEEVKASVAALERRCGAEAGLRRLVDAGPIIRHAPAGVASGR